MNSLNHVIIYEFEKLIDYTKISISKEANNRFKLKSFVTALSTIKSIDFEIKTTNQLEKMKGIGKGSIKRIKEILEKGVLSELNNQPNLDETSSVSEISNLMRITGIGPANAKKMYDQDITLKKMLDKPDYYYNKLTHHQIIGLKYFNDFETKIPRKEIDSLGNKIDKILKKIDSKLQMNICGSYRRGKEYSGDIDILINHPEYQTQDDFKDCSVLGTIINNLKSNGFLIDDLTYNGYTKYMGVCLNSPKGIARRIDIRMIPTQSFGCALLYFTGSGQFNINMRRYALKKNYKLNEYQLTKKINLNLINIEVRDERDIFKKLELEYVEPLDRLSEYIFDK